MNALLAEGAYWKVCLVHQRRGAADLAGCAEDAVSVPGTLQAREAVWVALLPNRARAALFCAANRIYRVSSSRAHAAHCGARGGRIRSICALLRCRDDLGRDQTRSTWSYIIPALRLFSHS